MTAYNIVRTRVKPGMEKRFIEAHRKINHDIPGYRGGALVKTGENSFCLIGEWSSFRKIADARPKMIGILNSFRDMLEDLGNGLGVTDPVSGEAVVTFKAAAKSKKKKAAKKAKKAEKKTAKKAKTKVKKAAKKTKKKK